VRIQRAPLSRPAPPRSTPIATTTLPFTMQLSVEGLMSMRAHEHAAKRVEASVADKYSPNLIPVALQREARGTTTKKRSARV
jgi:hypothetical protein